MEDVRQGVFTELRNRSSIAQRGPRYARISKHLIYFTHNSCVLDKDKLCAISSYLRVHFFTTMFVANPFRLSGITHGSYKVTVGRQLPRSSKICMNMSNAEHLSFKIVYILASLQESRVCCNRCYYRLPTLSHVEQHLGSAVIERFPMGSDYVLHRWVHVRVGWPHDRHKRSCKRSAELRIIECRRALWTRNAVERFCSRERRNVLTMIQGSSTVYHLRDYQAESRTHPVCHRSKWYGHITKKNELRYLERTSRKRSQQRVRRADEDGYQLL